ncbi:hypothetical protein HID58_045314 [Brassica napus]|uniref:Uncharacterized protein n=1 Tax=Brassica napus TaxID=3708 RepID=A0ABQ8AUN9_BRANA|nr:uncharacterized protein LOC106383912 [Brassica napus]KAH0895746.1 hypothetical protein HID58_045314 [Brassica napus]
MEEPGSDPGSYPIPPASVHLSPFSSLAPPPPSARLHFTRRRTQPLQSSPRYSSLKSLLDDPSGSALSIGRDETLAWELFTPHQRLMLVAVIGAAAADSKKNGLIRQLQKSIDLRDQALTGMQQMLDDLCQQLSLVKVSGHDDDLESKFKEKLLCDQHHHSSSVIQDKSSTNVVVEAEQEERRLSYLSDWCSSVTSAAELHFDNLSLDQDMLSLRKECQEKDATIKDLTSFLQLTNKACSKRETELEEIVRRKKIIIKKLKRDVLVLEEKVTQLTRLQRSSYSAAASNTCEFPMRVDNLLYDMDFSTASSSSDSDTPANTPWRTVLEEDAPVDSIKEEPSALERTNKSTASLVKSVKPSSIVSPMTTTRKPVSVSSSASSSRMRGASSSAGDSKKPRRPVQVAPRASCSGSHKRWV